MWRDSLITIPQDYQECASCRKAKVTCQILAGFDAFLRIFGRIDSQRLEGKIMSLAFIYQPYRVESGVGWLGLEPRTNALKGRCSTIELPTRSAVLIQERRRQGDRSFLWVYLHRLAESRILIA
jgi:hypothetical protein